MFLISSKVLKINFKKRKWNYPNRKWNYYSHLQASDKKSFYYKMFLICSKVFKFNFQKRKWNYPNRKWNYVSHLHARNRVDYYRKITKYLGVEVEGELKCGRMKQFGLAKTSAGAVATYWEQNWSTNYKCKLVSYQTPYSELVQDDSVKCLQEKFKIKLS